MPDSLEATRTRRAWRFLAALGCLLGATGILVGALLFRGAQHNTNRGTQAICAIIEYGEDTLDSLPQNPNANPDAIRRFRKLVRDMRDTGVKCPPHSVERRSDASS